VRKVGEKYKEKGEEEGGEKGGKDGHREVEKLVKGTRKRKVGMGGEEAGGKEEKDIR